MVAFNPLYSIAYVTNSGSSSVSVINTQTNTIINTITVGSSPVGVTFDPSGTYAYVTNQNGNSISVINVTTNSVIATIPVSGNPGKFTLNPTTATGYVTESSGNAVGVITIPETSVQSLPLSSGKGQMQLTVNAISSNTVSFTLNGVTYTKAASSGNSIYGKYTLYGFAKDLFESINVGSSSVTINPQLTFGIPQITIPNSTLSISHNETITANVLGGTPPYAFTWKLNGNTLAQSTQSITFYANSSDGGLDNIQVSATDNVLEQSTGTGTINVTAPFSLSTPSVSNAIIDVGQISIANSTVTGNTASYSGLWLWTPSNQIEDAIQSTILVGNTPIQTAISPDGTLAYVTNQGSLGTVSVISTATGTVINTIPIGQYWYPTGLAFSRDGKFVYMVNDGPGNIDVIKVATNSIAATITLGSFPNFIAVNPQSPIAYVTTEATGTVSVISTTTNSLTNTITTHGSPVGIAFDPTGSFAYVTNINSANVNVINVASGTITKTISVGLTPNFVAFNPFYQIAYVTNQNSGTVSVINTQTNSVINTIAVGSSPQGVTFDPSGTYAYVANQNSNTISIINVNANAVVGTIRTFANPETITVNPKSAVAYVTNKANNTVSIVPLQESGLAPQSSSQLQLTVNAISSNMISFALNGIKYAASTSGGNTIYGNYKLYAFANQTQKEVKSAYAQVKSTRHYLCLK